MNQVKLTFNKPAAHSFSEVDKAVRIRIQDGEVQFLPSSKMTNDAAPVAPRSRGGYESIIEGSSVDALADALKNNHGPFFTLERRPDGWMAAIPHRSPSAPPKFTPHVRVWNERTASAPRTVVAPSPFAQDTAGDMFSAVLKANEILSSQASPGRPSNTERQARTDAEEILNKFRDTATAVLGPRVLPDIDGLRKAHALLGKFIADMDAMVTQSSHAQQERTKASRPHKPRASATRVTPTPKVAKPSASERKITARAPKAASAVTVRQSTANRDISRRSRTATARVSRTRAVMEMA